MRNYWIRIALGALGIFAVGMIGVTLARRGMAKVSDVVAGTGPISIPLAIIPFQLNGNKLGNLQRLVLYRETPKKVSSVQLEVKLTDSLLARGLEGCRLAANLDSENRHGPGIHVRTGSGNKGTFWCSKEGADSGLVEYGHAVFHPGEITVPLLLPQDLVDDLRKGDFGDDADSSDLADSISDAVEARAESISDAAERMADSISRRSESLADSLRSEGARRADSARTAPRRMADSARAR
ncbi:MAG TPA: hypothetical protein VHR41_06520 [Gemmatimonadales bacterium]|jgi:hypothetical protein|nr:hypothetical protein [Gemmatimonadales bacterium]